MLSLECVCYFRSISSGVRYVPFKFVPARCLAIPIDKRHEYIPSCLFLLLLINIPLEGRKGAKKSIMKKYVLFAIIIGVCCNLTAQTFSSVAPSGQTLYYRINTYDTTATLTYDNSWGYAYQGLTGPLVIPENVPYNGYMYPVAKIDSGCFRGNVGLTSVTIPIHIRQLCYNSFAGCTGLTTINYNADSCALGWGYGAWDDADNAGIFEGCVNVTTINIGDSVRYVPPFVFYDCIGLQTLNVGKSVIRFHNDALPYEPTNLSTLNFNARRCGFQYGNGSSNEQQYYDYISNSYRYYKHWSPFQQCTSLTNVAIGNEVEGLYSYFFHYCTGLLSVVIPDAVTYMRNCFWGCSNLNTVTIGTSVEQLHGAFHGCNHLITINSLAEYPPICDEETFVGVPSYADIIVPCGAAYRYELSDYWNGFSRITENCTAIDDVDGEFGSPIYIKDGRIVIEGSEGEPVSVYDVVGREVVRPTRSDETPILPRGVYLVKVGTMPARKVVVL